MQISRVKVTPVELDLRVPYRTARHESVTRIMVLFVRIETKKGQTAWGCAACGPTYSSETLKDVIRVCNDCAELARDLNPLNTEYALDAIAPLTTGTPSVQCAFDMAFYDLLGLAANLPLYRLLGGYRDRIMTSITINIGSVAETVEMAKARAKQGFRILKIKGGIDPELDVRRVRSVHRSLPKLVLRLDADEQYDARGALEVARALEGRIEMLERPISSTDIEILHQVTHESKTPILVDASANGPSSALQIAASHAADGLSVRLATCGGIRCARQVDSIARSARLTTMVGCVNEPALLTAAGLGFALSSPNVRYGDLDGHFDLKNDPTRAGFILDRGWLIATDIPGLGCTVDL